MKRSIGSLILLTAIVVAGCADQAENQVAPVSQSRATDGAELLRGEVPATFLDLYDELSSPSAILAWKIIEPGYVNGPSYRETAIAAERRGVEWRLVHLGRGIAAEYPISRQWIEQATPAYSFYVHGFEDDYLLREVPEVIGARTFPRRPAPADVRQFLTDTHWEWIMRPDQDDPQSGYIYEAAIVAPAWRSLTGEPPPADILEQLEQVKTTNERLAPQNEPEFFDFQPDVRLFAAFCMMNVAGYDEGLALKKNEVRAELRRQCGSKCGQPLRNELRGVHRQRMGGSAVHYATLALLSAGPPEFALDPAAPDLAPAGLDETACAEFSRLMNRFYLEADIEAAWNAHRRYMFNVNHEFYKWSEYAKSDVVEYCRLNEDFYQNVKRRSHFGVYPQLAYHTEWRLNVNGEAHVILAPLFDRYTRGAASSDFYREALREAIEPLLDRHFQDDEKYRPLLARSRELGKAEFADGRDLVEQSILRALFVILNCREYVRNQEQTIERVYGEYRKGYILAPHVYENMLVFEQTQASLAEYFPEMLSNIDAEKEDRRWTDFQNLPGNR